MGSHARFTCFPVKYHGNRPKSVGWGYRYRGTQLGVSTPDTVAIIVDHKRHVNSLVITAVDNTLLAIHVPQGAIVYRPVVACVRASQQNNALVNGFDGAGVLSSCAQV